ncbi:MAG: hypothetical protein NZO58_04275 [Gemmataceae bacterium]|nr:hypothetical protein [Gemmataceae bacterium]
MQRRLIGRSLIGTAVAAACLTPISAQQPATLEELAKHVRPLLADLLPPVLYEKKENWGKTTKVISGVHWDGLRPRITKADRNDGTWKHIKLSVRNPKKSLTIDMHDLRKVDADTQAFQADVAFDCTVDYEQQNWESGVRLYSGSLRARLRVKIHMDCENLIRLENTDGAVLPDIVFRFRVVQAKVRYYDLVVEHIAGLGGTAAKIVGDSLYDTLRQWRPSLERKLLDRAAEAITKAADTKEVRIGLSGLLKDKK